MEHEQALVPKLRFPEYRDKMKFIGFSELGKIMIGLTHTPEYLEHGKPFLSSKNISKGFIDFENVQYISEEKFRTMPKGSKPIKGDILFTRVGSNLGNPIVLEREIEFGIFVSLGIFRVNHKANNYYIKNWIESSCFWRQLEQKVAGGAKNNLNTTWLKEFKLNIPSLQEQQKIASFLSAVDTKIQQLERKKELLEQYKKGIMQQLFNQELRFTQDDGSNYPDWEEKRLKDVLIHKSVRNKELKYNLVLSVSNTKGFISQSEQFDGYRVASKDVSNYKIVKRNQFAYNPSRINVGSIAKLKDYEIGIVSPMYVIFEVKKEFDTRYIEFLTQIHLFKHFVKVGCSGSVRDSLNYDDLESFKFSFPTKEEQTKIANFLSAIDSKIELVNTHITQTQTFKKGLLQKMFV